MFQATSERDGAVLGKRSEKSRSVKSLVKWVRGFQRLLKREQGRLRFEGISV